MNTWPDAPRLTETLNRLADQANVDTSAKSDTESMLLLRETNGAQELIVTKGDEVQPTAVSFGRRKEIPTQRSHVLALAAAMLVVAAAAALLLTRDPDATRTVTADNTTAEQPPPTAADSPPPELEYEDVCREGGMAPTARMVTTSSGAVEIGLARSDRATPLPDNLSVVSIGSSLEWANDALAQQIESTSALTDVTVYYVPAGVGDAQTLEILGTIRSTNCGSINYLVTTGPVDDAILCPDPTAGFSGYGLIDPGSPPTSCELFQPTVIISSDGGLRLPEWEDHYGCTDARSEDDGAGNEITTYGECATTLIIVRTSGPDPWAEPIGGVPTAEFVAQIVTIAK